MKLDKVKRQKPWVIFGCKGETTDLIIEPPTFPLCHPAGNWKENNKLITVDTEADYKQPYHRLTQNIR